VEFPWWNIIFPPQLISFLGQYIKSLVCDFSD